MDLGLQGAKALVTASTRGIGFAVARRLGLEGARVFICSRSREHVEEALRRLRSEGIEAYGTEADLRRADDVRRLVASAVEVLGGLDVVVYNTGGPRPGTFEELSLEDWREAERLLLESAVLVTREALPHLERSQHPAVVYVTSFAIREPVEGLTLSNVVRLSIAGLVRDLARTLGRRGIRFNMVLPGLTRTERILRLAEEKARREGRSIEEVLQEMASNVPLGRLADPDEVARVVAFLASPAASYVNGAAVPVDGGLLHHIL